MADYKLGCNFDFDLINKVKDLNDQYSKNRISEFYGSERRMAFLTARPSFRLPEISKDHLEEFVKQTRDIGVIFNYTCNTIFPGSKSFLMSKKDEIKDFVNYLWNIGVEQLTVSNPILMDLIREANDQIGLEVSTIMHIDAITQIKYLKEMYDINKVCGNLIKNRHIEFLKREAKYCNNNGINLELMVNEFCGVGGEDYTTHCVYRDSCYLYHATNESKEDANSLNGYPMNYCISSRKTHPINWMRTRFIRPEDIPKYEALGINHYKITGRTGTTNYLEELAKAYLSENWEGNLLSLWKPLETIYSEQNEFDFVQPADIPNKKLNGFIDHWFDNPNFDCSLEVCGETCRHCHDFFYKYVNK